MESLVLYKSASRFSARRQSSYPVQHFKQQFLKVFAFFPSVQKMAYTIHEIPVFIAMGVVGKDPSL